MKGLTRASLLLLGLLALAAQAEVVCINANQNVVTTPSTDFGLHADGTAMHIPTGLMWMRCSLGQGWDGSTCAGTAASHTWQAALQGAIDINSGDSNADNDGQPGFAGYTDWRLPNKNELASIIERHCTQPESNAAVFPATPSARFWTSSPYANDAGHAWYVSFNGGPIKANAKGVGYYVRLVRAGQ